MASVNETMDLRASPASVRAVIGSPDALSDWHPAVTASPVSDGVRRLTLVDGAGLVEAIVEHSDDERFYVYEITESPLPVTGYRSRIAVEEADGGARVVWQVDFEADDPAAADAIAETSQASSRPGSRRSESVAWIGCPRQRAEPRFSSAATSCHIARPAIRR